MAPISNENLKEGGRVTETIAKSGDTAADSSAFPQPLRDAIDLASKNRLLILMTIGYGLCRIASGSPAEFAELEAARAAADAGKLVGILLIVLIAYTVGRRRGSFALLVAPSALATLSLVAGAFCPLLPDSLLTPAATVLLFLGNLGSSALMLQWLEIISCAPLRDIVLVIAGAELVNALFVFSMGASHLTAAITAMAVGMSVLLFLFCRRSAETSQLLPIAYARRDPDGLGRLVSPRLTLWVTFYCLAYGFVTAYTGLNLESAANSLGGMLPCLLILGVAAFLPHRFDLHMLKNLAFILMVLGLLLVGIMGSDAVLAQILTGSGAASCRLCGYALACMHARRSKISALLGCAAVQALIIVATLAGLALGGADLPVQGTVVLVGLTVIACALSAFLSPFNLDEETLIAQSSTPLRARSRKEVLGDAAAEHGLSPREATVFSLMAAGMDTARIAEELFITKGAVRAHQSRIYAKFNVHAQEEFDRVIESLG